MGESNPRKPKIGEMVVYILASGSDFGQSRPAQIVEVFEAQNEAGNERDSRVWWVTLSRQAVKLV